MQIDHVRRLKYLLSVGGAVLSSAVGLAAYMVYSLNGPRRRVPQDTYTFSPWEVQVPCETVSFQTEDGITIRGWWFPHEDTNRVIIGCPGPFQLCLTQDVHQFIFDLLLCFLWLGTVLVHTDRLSCREEGSAGLWRFRRLWSALLV